MEMVKNIFLSINNYLGLALPIWMESRKNLVIYFLLDSLILLIIFQNTNPNYSVLRIVLFTLIWGLISYIFGRYSKNNKHTKIFLIFYFLIQNTFITILITYLIEKTIIVFFKDIIPSGRNLFLYLGFGSLILQSFRTFIIYKFKIVRKSIFIVGEIKDINIFKEKAKNHIDLHKIKVLSHSSIDESLKNNKSNFITIILVSSLEYLNNYDYILRESVKRNIEVLTSAEWFEKYLQKIPSELISKNTLDYRKRSLINANSRMKRFCDILVSFFLLIITSPILLISAILIKIEDNGPIIYTQKRTGLYEQNFKIIKLRSMKVNSEKYGPVWANKKDKRVTKIGALIRKTRIDELPQLWNVLIGDMSLIGPRPERPEIEEELNRIIPNYKFRHIIKPGLSGWAQVNFPYGASVSDSSEKLSYDLFYIQNKSIWLDIFIFFKTIKIIFTMYGSSPK